MESVIYEDSPLAQYLEAEGEAPSDWASVPVASEPPSPSLKSFAPRGPSNVRSQFRDKIPRPLQLSIPQTSAVARIHNTCSRAVNSRLGRSDNASFLEQFRYIIIASQLLNIDSNAPYHSLSNEIEQPTPAAPATHLSLVGAVATGIVAFALVYVLQWARRNGPSHLGKGRATIAASLIAIATAVLYAYFRRKWLTYIRQHAVDSASRFVTDSQNLDAAASASIALIQEVELISRGYRLSTPLPPVSRLEDQTQTKRCARLRRALKKCLVTALPPYIQACDRLRPLAEDLDLERYCDIYELSEMDIQDAELGANDANFDDGESLRALKVMFHRLRTLRRVLLCCLLAIDADGGSLDFARWGAATDEIKQLDVITAEANEKLRRILSEEEHFAVPPTPKSPQTPGKERVRVQLRKLNALSQGVRGFQAKLHLLREESAKSFDDAGEVSELGSSLMAQYESLGNDLKLLLHEWENGKSALTLNMSKHESRMSLASNGVKSPTPSLGGNTVVDGSPSDALRALTGEEKSPSSVDLSNSENEEVFEAIGLPRQRSALSRDERIAKMKDERARLASKRESAQANTHMLRELESVINLRPRAKTAGHRITTL